MGTITRSSFMHSNGTTPFETIGVIIPSFSYTLITNSILLTTTIENKTSKFLLEFTTLVLPIILNVTILSEFYVEILIATLLISAGFFYTISNQQKPKNERKSNETHFVTNARSTINLISVIAILAVDFKIFPRKYAKTENWGYSLMDVGTGLYIFSNGLVHSVQNFSKILKSTVILLVLGIGRFVFTQNLDYNVPVTEYGLHWNFFITLAVVKLFTAFFLNIVNIKFVYINALLLIVSHETLLQMGLKNYVFSNIKRDNFLVANREGIFSAMGYCALYLLSAFIGHFLNIKNKNADKTDKTLSNLTLLSVILLFLSLFLENSFGISRKLVNSAYIFWVLFIGVFMTTLFYLLEFYGSVLAGAPIIYKAINYNGLTFFLIGNLLTGLINISIDTLKISDSFSLFIIIVYMFVNCSIVCYLFYTGIKLKL